MKFTSEIKKLYKSMKKSFSSFFQTIGFNKQQAHDIAQSTLENITATWKQIGIDENVINGWNSIAKEAKEFKKKQISLPKLEQTELQKMIDSNGKLIPFSPTRNAPTTINNNKLGINPISKQPRAKKYREEDLLKIREEINTMEQKKEIENERE